MLVEDEIDAPWARVEFQRRIGSLRFQLVEKMYELRQIYPEGSTSRMRGFYEYSEPGC